MRAVYHSRLYRGSMRIATAVVVLALALPAPLVLDARTERRRGSETRRESSAGELLVHAAALPVTTIGNSTLVFAIGDRFVATGVRLGRGARLCTWIVEWDATLAGRAAPRPAR
jgi:hypothetical protein